MLDEIGSTPEPTYRHNARVGRQLRQGRIQRDMTLAGLSERVSIPEDDLRAYEEGRERASISELLQMADALRVPILSFFKDS